MPQVTFEHSVGLNVADKAVDDLFAFIAKKMNEVFGVTESATKFRSIKLEKTTVIGKDNKFVHLAIALLKKADRSQEKFDELGRIFLEYIGKNFSVDEDAVAVEFREMDPAKYYKN